MKYADHAFKVFIISIQQNLKHSLHLLCDLRNKVEDQEETNTVLYFAACCCFSLDPWFQQACRYAPA